LLAKASETDQGGRYFNRTLEEIDQMSFVRDRGISQQIEEEEEEEEDGMEEDVKDEAEDVKPDEQLDNGPDTERDGPAKTGRQQALEAEWGLYRSPQLSQRSEEEDDKDTDDERRGASHRSAEEDFMVSRFVFCSGDYPDVA
jgi:DNA ligase-4